MYTIGEFAALARVSVRMLRHYDAIGLLAPAAVDPHTGYRSYAITQLPFLLRIAELRELGVGLERIHTLARSGDGDAGFRALLDERRTELAASIADDRDRIARIERRLRQLEGTTMSDVVYTHVEPVTVYATSGVARGVGPEHVSPVVGPLIESLDAALLAAGRELVEPGIFWYSPAEDEGLEVHVSYVAETPAVAGDGYEVVELPGIPTAATLRHHGVLDGIGESWAQLFERLVADGYRVSGPTREVYLVADGHEPGPDWVTELQAPVERVSA